MDKIKRHKELCEQMNAVYTEKNKNYGDSFGLSVKKYGMIAALTRISDKFHRLEQLILTRSDGTKDESLIDTMLDMANYCLMTVMEIEEANAHHTTDVAKTLEKLAEHPSQALYYSNPSPAELEEFFKSSIELHGN